jgi:YD repeat-containing protein
MKSGVSDGLAAPTIRMEIRANRSWGDRLVDLFGIARRTLPYPFLILMILWGGLSTAQATTHYFYDTLGRLITVLNADGSTIDYQYDANGNVTTINREIPQTLSIVAFTPNVAYSGSILSIYGTGFSTNPGQNGVTVGGAAASVSSSTNTSIVTTVPLDATTGPITVSVAGVTATSSQNLTVLREPVVLQQLHRVAERDAFRSHHPIDHRAAGLTRTQAVPEILCRCDDE